MQTCYLCSDQFHYQQQLTFSYKVWQDLSCTRILPWTVQKSTWKSIYHHLEMYIIRVSGMNVINISTNINQC